MWRHTLAVVAVGLLVGVLAPPGDAGKKELERLRGA
jgi:hypothetical protein